MIHIIKRKDRSFHCGFRHTLANFEEYCVNGEKFSILEARTRKDITRTTLLNLLQKKEPLTGNVELLNRIILAGGLVAYVKLLEKIHENSRISVNR